MIVPASQKALRYIPKSLLREPFDILLAVMCLFSGIPYLLGAPPAAAIDRQLPEFLFRAWGGCLTLGGILVLVGIFFGLTLLQRAGLSLLAPTAIMYAIVLLIYIKLPAIFSASLLLGFAGACLLKDYTIKIATQSISKIFKEVSSGGQ